jgi:hypothetical protein
MATSWRKLWRRMATFAYRVGSMVSIARLSALALTGLLSACASTPGVSTPSAPPPVGSAKFSAPEFAWSQRPGANVIAGRVAYKQGAMRYTCAGSTVVLTPETAWSRLRMQALYGSVDRAALPAEEVRARTPSAPPGDAGPYVRRTTCDDADQFAFGGLPDGAWFAITIAKPAGAQGGGVALMRRVVVRGGKVIPLAL